MSSVRLRPTLSALRSALWRLSIGCLLAGIAAAGPTQAPTVQLTLSLKDGSLIIGTCSDDTFPISSDAIGTVKLPLSRVHTIKFGGDGKADTFALKNGDKLKGIAGFSKVTLQTVFGTVSIKKGELMAMEIRPESDPARSDVRP